jgi:hypothetical protein
MTRFPLFARAAFAFLAGLLLSGMHRSGLILAASSFPNGTIFSLATPSDTQRTITAISNAATGIASATAHGYSDGDIVLLNVASRLDLRVARVDAPATNSFALEGFDTQNTTLYPSGFGVGYAREAGSFTPVSQVTDVQSQGGEQQFYQWVYLDDGRQRQRPTFKNARSMTVVMDYDPSLAWHAALEVADQLGTEHFLLAQLPSGVKIYYSVYVGFDGEPSFTINENQKTTATFALASPRSTRYAS